MPPRVRATVDDKPADETPEVAETTEDKPEAPEMCAEHFPLGWKSAVVVQANERLGVVQPVVFCEHGAFTRPVEPTAFAVRGDELAKLRARIAELEAAAPKTEGEPTP